MANRSLTDLFKLMRNNALQSRLIYQDQNSIRADSLTVLTKPPVPKWIKELTEAQLEITKLKQLIDVLKQLHHKNLYRPSLDDISSDERKIEDLTREITSILSGIHRVIQYIKTEQQMGDAKERRLKQNVVRTLAISLQELTIVFRGLQNSYLTQIQSREQRLNFFDTSNVTKDDLDSKFMIIPKIESPVDMPNIRFNQRRDSGNFSLDKFNFSKDDCKIS